MNKLIEDMQAFASKKRVLVVFLLLLVFIGFVFVVSMILKKQVTKSTNNSPTLGPCTSSATDSVENLPNWKISMYAAPLESSTPDASQSVAVKMFSLKGIQDKTEKNSFYVRLEMQDSSYITGYDTGIELCDSTNRTNAIYQVTKNTAKDIIGENISASMHYLHGGKYILEPGTFRADAYVKTKDGVWHLVGRTTDLVVTE